MDIVVNIDEKIKSEDIINLKLTKPDETSISTNDKPKFNRARNRSRSTVIIRKQEVKTFESLDKPSSITHRSRASTEFCIQPDLHPDLEKKSIFTFKPKVDKSNIIINEFYEKMKNYYNQDLVTPLELLNLKFYVNSIQPVNIKIYKDEPELSFLQKHELSLFIKENVLCCKLYKSNKFIISDYEINSYNRFINVITSLPNKNSYCKHLEIIKENNDFKCDDINRGDEILAAWDKERLFSHIVKHNYIIKENCNKWPKLKNSELLAKIKPKDLLDKFWKTPITDNLSNEEYLSKLDKESVELVLSSIIFLLEQINNTDQIKYLRTILFNLYKKLSIIDTNNEKLHYESAKYATFLELYIEAWDSIHRCNISFHCKKEDIIWLKQLKICYLCYLMKKSSRNDITLSKNYINIGHFTKIINDLEDENDDISNTLEVADHFLEGLVRLYYYDETLIHNEISKWSYDIIFILSCTSYCRSAIEKNNEKCLLTISQICLELLLGKQYILNKDCIIQVSKISNQFCTLINESSKIIIIMKINILFDLAKISSIILDDLSQILYLKSFELLSKIENFISTNNFYNKYDDNIIEYIIEKSIENSKNVEISTINILNLSQILIERNHITNTYLLILKFLIERKSWVSCYNFLTKSIKLIPNINNLEEKELIRKIENNYLEIENYKRNLSDALLAVIETICDEEVNDLLKNNWINECFILTETQYMLIEKSKLLLKTFKEKYIFDDFKNLEKTDFTYKLYEFFGIPSSFDIFWLPEKYLDPSKYIDCSMENQLNNNLRKSNGVMVNEKMIESIKKMVALGKSNDDIAFFFNIPIITINKILRDY